MQILGTGYNIPWLPQPNEISLILDETLPPRELITSALALAFHEGNFLMTNLHQRGWDLPGGHEVMEEAAVALGSVRLLGYQCIRLLGDVPEGYRYPQPDSFQVLYIGTVAKILPFSPTAEASARTFFPLAEALQQRWVQDNQLMFDAAYQMIAR